MSADPRITRRPFPLGKLCRPRVILARAVNRPPLVGANRYPGQIIGFGVRLPCDGRPGHPYLSFVWASPSRWWDR